MQTILPLEFRRGTALMLDGVPQKGSSQATFKPAKLEGGLEIMVPLFIGPDEIIRVDTRERKHLGKENVE